MQELTILATIFGVIIPFSLLDAEEMSPKKIQEIKEETYKKLQRLEFVNKRLSITQGDLYRPIAESLKPGFKSGVIRPFSYDIFKSCKGNCLEKFKKSLKNHEILGFNPEESFIQDVYTDPSHKEVLGNLIYTYPLTLILNNELHIMPKENVLYRDYFGLSGQDKEEQYLPPVIPLGDKGSAMWLPWIKEIGYLKPGSYLTSERFEGLRNTENQKCFQDNYRRGFTRIPTLYDFNGKRVEKDKLKNLIISGYKVEDKSIIIYLFDNSLKKSNLIDGVRIRAYFLLSYPYERQIIKYKMNKNDLIDVDGNVVIYQIHEVEYSYRVTCPVEYPKEVLSKLKNGELKFHNLGEEYLSKEVLNNINFNCNGTNSTPACDNRNLDTFTPQ